MPIPSFRHVVAQMGILMVSVSLLAAAQTPVNYSPKQISQRIMALQTVTLEMNDHRVLDQATTRAIMNWTKDADTLLRTFPKGWRDRLATTWTMAKTEIHTTNPPVLEQMAMVDAVLGT